MTTPGEAISHILAMVPPRVATSSEDMLAHVRSASARGLPLPKLCRPHNRLMSVAGGGPSLNVSEIDRSSVIVTVNAGLSHLLDQGITPWACGLLDARPHIADLIEPHPDVFYFVASTCHPSVFDKLKDCKVILWHPTGLPGIETVVPAGHDLIAGASTMGLRWLNLAHYMGFRRFDFHGLDSSYAGDRTHAYADYRDGRGGSIEIDGYQTDNNFLEQVKDWFQLQELFKLDPEPPQTRLFGDGLLQHTARKREALINNWPRRAEAKPLNVICVSTGDYCGRGEDYVSHLLAGVARNFDGKCKFHVLRDGPVNWWAKLQMFEPGRFPKGERCVYFDLDTIITGPLDDLMAYDGPFAALRDVWQPGQMGSGIMSWTAGECDHVWTEWVKAGKPTDDPHGDQAWIGKHMPMAIRLQDIIPGQLVSFKAQCRDGVPDGARVVFYHGLPRPHETPLW